MLAAAAAADIGISAQSGRHLRSTSHNTRGRTLKKLDFPQITFPQITLPQIQLPEVHFPDPLHVSVPSSSPNNSNDNESEFTATSSGDGSSASSSSSTSDGGQVAVASIECVVPVNQLYIPVA